MRRINKAQAVLTMSKHHKPAAAVQSGEIVTFETSDCFNNQLNSEKQSLSDLNGKYLNPATGPLYVEGAEEGDILKVEIIDIIINNIGVMTADKEEDATRDIYVEDRIRIIPIKGNFACFNELINIPLYPMIGVIGVAPAGEEVSTVLSGSYGGNMDCKEIVKGSTLYLPVNIKGALLAMGDLHAVMGDGETGGCGLEVSGEVTVKVEVVKNKVLPLPMLVSGNKLITIATESTIEEANRKATIDMHRFLVSELGIESHEAGFLISMIGDLKVCQIVDPLKTARMEIPMDILSRYGYDMP